MTHTIGKIEQLSNGMTVHVDDLEAEIWEQQDDLTIAYMVGYVKGKDFAKREAVQIVAKWLCDEGPISEECLTLARQILGVNHGK